MRRIARCRRQSCAAPSEKVHPARAREARGVGVKVSLRAAKAISARPLSRSIVGVAAVIIGGVDQTVGESVHIVYAGEVVAMSEAASPYARPATLAKSRAALAGEI